MAHFVYHFRTNDSKLYEMLALRSQGWSYTALAERFDCPKLTIRFLARKYGMGQNTISVQYTRTDYLSATTRDMQETTQTTTEERVNEGKTYAEYLAEEQARRAARKLAPAAF